MIRRKLGVLMLACLAGGGVVCLPAAGQETGLPDIPTEPDGTLAGQPLVTVTEFRFEGNSVFTDEQLLDADLAAESDAQQPDEQPARQPDAQAAQTAPAEPAVRRVRDYLGKEVTTEQLEQVRQALTRLYVKQGFINSGAILPDQTVEGGVITYRIVEGKLTDVNLEFRDPANPLKVVKGRLRPQYVISRVRRGAKAPLNIFRLRNQLEVARQNPNITRINAELRPGTEPGEAYLDVQVAESNPLQLGAQISNRRSPSVGAEQLELLASHRNLTGNGDLLAVRYGVNTGGFENWEWAGADDFSIDYTIPITPADTTLSISYTRTDSSVVEEPFDELDITSDSNSVALTLRHPFYRSANAEFAMFISQGYRDNETELLGEPFSFSPGAEDGESVVAPVRIGQEYTARSQVDAFALRSTFSLGTPLFDATQNGREVADGKYFAWLGQVQYVRRLRPTDPNPLHDWQLVLRGSAQFTKDRLLSIEQFAVGGIDTVRGYRENQIVRDIGYAGSVELHIPLVATVSGRRILELVPFVDLGYGRNVRSPSVDEFLPSIGVGLVYTNDHVTAQVFYGYALDRDINQESDDLQDAGIHFNVLFLAF